MKIIFFISLFLTSLLADDFNRINIIVSDISELRAENEKCQSKLKNITYKTEKSSLNYERLYNKQKHKNVILKAQLEYSNDLQVSNKNLANKVKELEKIVKKQENILKIKSKNNKNTFSTLVMKEKYQEKYSKKEKIIRFKATSFYLNENSNIYNDINGNKIFSWKEGRSFTSNKKTKKWIKITGYFVDKKWQRARKEMWIKLQKVSKK
ncbi:MAG: hypothetical protein L3J10_08425 [Sulfurimonas sp.]|nr:hypothetical protein [Sulfurimonas sp.]